MSGEHDLTTSDPRVIARRHTTQLLKMLRGYGPKDESAATAVDVDPVAAAESAFPVVAEAAGAYLRLMAAPNRQPFSPPIADTTEAAPAPPQRRTGSVLTVGETLPRQQGALGRLMTQTCRLAESNRIFQAYLLPHLRDHTMLLRMDQEAWTVQTDSASWATRLRYALHDIRLTLGQEIGFPLPKPQIRVVPAACPVQPQRPRLTLTEQNTQFLEAAAHNTPDVRLSIALRRLAEHVGSARKPPDSA
ncbi:MAG: DciA family protein [Candidatus Competibacteraceae bacterium]